MSQNQDKKINQNQDQDLKLLGISAHWNRSKNSKNLMLLIGR